jgi:hypothetical protein
LLRGTAGLRVLTTDVDILEISGNLRALVQSRRGHGEIGSDTGIRTRILALRGLRPNP